MSMSYCRLFCTLQSTGKCVAPDFCTRSPAVALPSPAAIAPNNKLSVAWLSNHSCAVINRDEDEDEDEVDVNVSMSPNPQLSLSPLHTHLRLGDPVSAFCPSPSDSVGLKGSEMQ